ncbi:MAG: hypothetical protein O7G87_10790 [bacterium]|nr:hypothetical protein [bacterium]
MATSFESHSEQATGSAPAPERVTFRALVLGVITIGMAMWYTSYFATNLVKSYLPVVSLIPFVMWVGINMGLNRFATRFALSRTELLTIFGMMWLVGNLSATGWGLYAVSLFPGPEFYASPENRLREVVIPFLPDWLFLDANVPIVRQVYTGLRQGETVPWLLWARPFFWWFVACIAGLMAGFFGSVLFYKQWHEKERLVFPMSQFSVALVEGADEGRVPVVFRDRVFWIGFACVAGVIGWNIIGYFTLSLPRITVFGHWLTKAVSLGVYYPPYYLRIQPLLMGLAYLCPVDILFSVWFYDLINIFKMGALNRTGFTVGLPGQPAKAGEITNLEMHGALVFLVLWSLWVAREHLKETFQKGFVRPQEDDDGAPVTYRMAWIGLAISTFGLVGWMLSSGMSIGAAVVQLVLLFFCYFGIAKYAATTGFTFLIPGGSKGLGLMNSMVGTQHLTPGSQTMMVLMNRNIFMGAASRTTSLVAIPHIFRMLGRNLRRHPWIWGMIPLAYLVGYVSAGGFYLERCYAEGGLNGLMVPNAMNSLTRQLPYIEGSKVTVFDPQKFGVWLFGFAQAGVLMYLRNRFTWWSFHPVAVAFRPRMYAFCVFLVWLMKVVVLRFGGIGLYRRSIPFWYGAIVGYLVGVAVSSVIDAIWFPDQGHFVHGW